MAATRGPKLSRSALAAILGVNALWAVGSIAFVALDAGSADEVGAVWIVLQALVVSGRLALRVMRRDGQDRQLAEPNLRLVR